MLPLVYELSDVIPGEAKVVGFHGLYREVKMWDVVDEGLGPVSHFFRRPRLDHFVQILTELTSIEILSGFGLFTPGRKKTALTLGFCFLY